MEYLIIELVNGNWSSWPIVFIIVFVILEYYHHNAISDLIGRIKHIKINREYFEVSGTTKQQNVSELEDDVVKLKSVECKEEEKKETEKNNFSNYIKHYEKLKCGYELERIYNVIYRSQILMMLEIKNNNNMPMPYQYSYSYFYSHLNFLNPNDRGKENPILYFQWLENTNLVKGTEDGYILTQLGYDFLKYIYENNYNINLKIL